MNESSCLILGKLKSLSFFAINYLNSWYGATNISNPDRFDDSEASQEGGQNSDGFNVRQTLFTKTYVSIASL
jgi:hypothetical protein